MVQLFPDLPPKTEEAQKTYATLIECTFTPKSLGASRQDEIMACDCKEQWVDGVNVACSEDSDCINRLTSVECSNADSNCGHDCRNQRFQHHEYAPVDVIQTEKKGYGLRATSKLGRGSFVYEYIGEVIDEPKFRKRMKQYEEQKRPHFYFMMLQKGEFIDATIKGGLARFCNHSCNPNSYVDKWVVNGKLRMGIFTKRDVLPGEEITFDYNVDRYGSVAQPCYCGEANCIGYLGGKTQTEAASKLPRILIDGLGLDDSDQKVWVTTNAKLKRAKSKAKGTKDGSGDDELDLDEDAVAILPTKQMNEEDVSKVMASLLQGREQWLISKLVQRIHISVGSVVNFRVMRMHGYRIFSSILRDWKVDEGICDMILEILARWPRLTKNKISSSKIETTVQDLRDNSEFDSVRDLASKLIEEWATLKMAYRIPRREKGSEGPETKSEDEPIKEEEASGSVKEEEDDARNSAKLSDSPQLGSSLESERRIKERKDRKDRKFKPLPDGWDSAIAENGKMYFYHGKLGITTWQRPTAEAAEAQLVAIRAAEDLKAQQLQKIIDQASQAAAAAAAATAIETPDRKLTAEEKLQHKLVRTFASYVPNLVARFEIKIGHDKVKHYSKEIVSILVEKEMRPGHVVKNPHELSDEKKTKVKAFVLGYMDKVVYKLKNGTADPRAHRDESSKSRSQNGHDSTPVKSNGTGANNQNGSNSKSVGSDQKEYGYRRTPKRTVEREREPKRPRIENERKRTGPRQPNHADSNGQKKHKSDGGPRNARNGGHNSRDGSGRRSHERDQPKRGSEVLPKISAPEAALAHTPGPENKSSSNGSGAEPNANAPPPQSHAAPKPMLEIDFEDDDY